MQHPVHWVLGVLSVGWGGGHEFDYSLTYSAKVMYEWNCTSALLVSFYAIDRYNFNIIFTTDHKTRCIV